MDVGFANGGLGETSMYGCVGVEDCSRDSDIKTLLPVFLYFGAVLFFIILLKSSTHFFPGVNSSLYDCG